MAMKKKQVSKRAFPPLAPRTAAKPTSFDDLELADLLDAPALQSMMDAFFALEHIGIGIIDLAGKVLVATGWQDICTKFHRVHPQACKHCIESDTLLSAGVEPGAFKTYRCRNNLWDSATPIVVGGRHMGNLFLGQFFFDDEEPDPEVFRAQARQHGFDETDYLAALGRVPRWSREKVARAMEFYARLAGHISELGYRNFQAARMLAERKQAEERLKQDDALLRLAGKTASFGGWTVDLAENRVVWSDEVAAIHDMPAGSSPSLEEAIAFYAPEWRDRIARAFQACAAKGVAYDEELEIVTAQGRRRWVRTNGVPVRNDQGRIVRVQGSFQNITERKLREEEHAFAARLMAIVGAPGDLHERLAELTRVLQEWSKCEAVGIRLRNGEDFPYFETRGFPPEFVRGESRLCACGPDGRVLRDGEGNPVLECMCGNILCGRFDPAKPYFTARGSFWTNSTTGLLATSTEADRQARTRNRCNGEGYESVALIPLRTADRTLGLLQFNDVRPGRFTPGMIAHLERIADGLAGVLARREAEERLRLHAQLLDSVRESVVASDAQGLIVYWSRGAEALYGYAAEEVLGKPYRNFAGAIEPPDEEAFRREILAKGSWRGEHLQRRRNGETVWTSTVVFPVKDGLDRPAGFVGIDLDITDRKRAELSLKQSERTFQNLVETINDIVFSIGPDGRVAYVSPAARALTGYDPAEIAGTPFTDWIDPRDHAALLAAWNEVLAGRARPGEYRIRTRSGETRWVRTSSNRMLENGAIAGIHGVMTDITERKQAEEALRRSETRYRTFIEAGSDLVFLKDDAFRYLISNGANNAFLGKPEADVIGRTDFDLLPRATAERCRAGDQDALAQGRTVAAEERVGEKIYQTFKFPVPLADGRIGVGGTIRDITRQKEAEEEINRLSKFPSENPSPVLRVDRAGRILFANKAGTPILNFWKSEVGGTVPADWLEKFAGVFAAGRDVEAEMDCAGRIFACILTPIPGEDYANLYGRDITDRKRAEKTLRLSEEKFAKAFQTAPYAISITRVADGRFIEVNEVFFAVTGHTRAEALAGTAVDLGLWVRPENRESVIADLCAGRSVSNREYLFRRKDGNLVTTLFSAQLIQLAEGPCIISSIADITARKQAEKALRESESRLQKIFDILPIGLWFADKTGKLLRGNPAGVEIWGAEPRVDPSEYGVFKARRLPSGEEIAPDDWALAHAIREGTTTRDELLEIDAFDGRKKIILNSTAPVLDDNGAIEGAVIVNQDITERHRAEDALAESEQRHRDYLAHSPHGIFVADEQGRLVQVNPAACRITGYSKSELLAMTVPDLHGESGWEDAARHFQAVLREGQAAAELRFQPKSGESRWWFVSAVKISATRFLGYCNDITERKQAEQALQESEARHRSILNSSPDDITIADLEGRILMVSPSAAPMFGYREERELIGRRIVEFIVPADRERAHDDIARLFQGALEGPSEYRALRADGSGFDIEVNGEFIRDADGTPRSLLLIVRDITERKRAEETLKKAYAGLALAQQAAGAGMWSWDMSAGTLDWTPEFFHLFGLDPATATADFATWRKTLHPEDLAAAEKRLADSVRDRRPLENEYRIVRPSGEIRWIFAAGDTTYDADGKPLSMAGICIDITERKRAETALREAKQITESIIDTVPMRVFWKDRDLRFLGCNKAFARDAGFSDPQDLVGKDDRQMGWRAQAELYRADDRQVIKSGKPKLFIEEPQTTPDGKTMTLLTSKIPLRDAQGEICGVLGTYMDITERKQAEEKLRTVELRLRDIASNIPGAVYQLAVNRKGSFEVPFMSAGCETLFGRAVEGLDYAALWFDRMPPEDLAALRKSLAAAAKRMEAWSMEFRIALPDGSLKWLRGSANPLRLSGGGLLWNGVLLDITELKRTEQALREREAFQNLLMDTIPNPVFYKDLQGRYLGVNKAFQALTGKSKEELAGKTVLEIASPDLANIYHAKDVELFERPGTQIYEAPTMDAAGNRHDVIFHKASIVDENGDITGLVGVILDITERKRAEEKALRENALGNAIIESIPGTFYMLDENGKYVRWSSYQRDEIVGKPEDQIAGFPALATIHPDDREIIQARIANVLATGAVEVVEGRVLLRGGPAFRWLLMTGRRLMIEGHPHLVGIGIDITERKRMEAEAAAQLDELRRWQTATLGREGRVAELKREVNALAVRLGTPPPYPSAEAK